MCGAIMFSPGFLRYKKPCFLPKYYYAVCADVDINGDISRPDDDGNRPIKPKFFRAAPPYLTVDITGIASTSATSCFVCDNLNTTHKAYLVWGQSAEYQLHPTYRRPDSSECDTAISSTGEDPCPYAHYEIFLDLCENAVENCGYSKIAIDFYIDLLDNTDSNSDAYVFCQILFGGLYLSKPIYKLTKNFNIGSTTFLGQTTYYIDELTDCNIDVGDFDCSDLSFYLDISNKVDNYADVYYSNYGNYTGIIQSVMANYNFDVFACNLTGIRFDISYNNISRLDMASDFYVPSLSVIRQNSGLCISQMTGNNCNTDTYYYFPHNIALDINNITSSDENAFDLNTTLQLLYSFFNNIHVRDTEDSGTFNYDGPPIHYIVIEKAYIYNNCYYDVIVSWHTYDGTIKFMYIKKPQNLVDYLNYKYTDKHTPARFIDDFTTMAKFTNSSHTNISESSKPNCGSNYILNYNGSHLVSQTYGTEHPYDFSNIIMDINIPSIPLYTCNFSLDFRNINNGYCGLGTYVDDSLVQELTVSSLTMPSIITSSCPTASTRFNNTFILNNNSTGCYLLSELNGSYNSLFNCTSSIPVNFTYTTSILPLEYYIQGTNIYSRSISYLNLIVILNVVIGSFTSTTYRAYWQGSIGTINTTPDGRLFIDCDTFRNLNITANYVGTTKQVGFTTPVLTSDFANTSVSWSFN